MCANELAEFTFVHDLGLALGKLYVTSTQLAQVISPQPWGRVAAAVERRRTPGRSIRTMFLAYGCNFPVGRQGGTHTFTMGLQLTQFARKMDANGKAAGSVEVKVFNKKVCMTADSSY